MAPNTAFYYRVGDEFRRGSEQIRDNTDYGNGQILFFVGSPAEHCESVAMRSNSVHRTAGRLDSSLYMKFHPQSAATRHPSATADLVSR